MKKSRKIYKEYKTLDPSYTTLIGKTNFPTSSKDSENFDTNNKTITLNVLFPQTYGD